MVYYFKRVIRSWQISNIQDLFLDELVKDENNIKVFFVLLLYLTFYECTHLLCYIQCSRYIKLLYFSYRRLSRNRTEGSRLSYMYKEYFINILYGNC